MTGPLANPLPPLDAATEAALRESIWQFGVLAPVLVDELGETVDGHHRKRIADELGVAYSERVVVLPDDPAERATAIEGINDARRQRLSPEERRKHVAALREAGHSLRHIAGAVGVGKDTVAHDLQVSTPRQVDEITGQDGKTYPAAKPRPAADIELAERAERMLERERERERELPEPTDEAVRARLAKTTRADPARAEAIWRRTLDLHGVGATPAQVAAVAADTDALPDTLAEVGRMAAAARKAVRTGESRAARQALAIWRATVYRELDRIASADLSAGGEA